MDSANQDAWVEVAQAIRTQLGKCALDMPAMKPDEIKAFIEAAQAAYWLELNAMIFDKKVDLELSRVYAD